MMRSSRLASVTVAASAMILAMPAMAHEWYARKTPFVPEDQQASPICYMSSGETLPLVAFTFERERTRFAVRAAEFIDWVGINEYSGTLPSGASFTISLGSDQSSNAAVLTFANRDRGLGFLAHFLKSGDFYVTGNGLHVAIPALPSASGEIESLQTCLKELNNG